MADRLAVKRLKKDEEERLKKTSFIFTEPAIKVIEEGYLFPDTFKNVAGPVYNLKVKPTDVYVVTFPKSGTTWMQEIVWSLLYNPDLDNPRGDLVMDDRSPCIEADLFYTLPGLQRAPLDLPKPLEKLSPEERLSDEIIVWAKTLESPRVLKSHLPFALLNPQVLHDCKAIYIARDPRDVIYSYYYFSKLHNCFGYTGTLNEYVDEFIDDQVVYAPYWSHIKQAWEKRNSPNLYFVFYEDLKNDLASQVKRIDKFLGTNRTDKQIQNVVHHTTFEQMKENSKDNQPTSFHHQYFDEKVMKEGGGFFRQGQAGDWKKRFTPEQMKKINAWMAKNLPDFGNDFPYRI